MNVCQNLNQIRLDLNYLRQWTNVKINKIDCFIDVHYCQMKNCFENVTSLEIDDVIFPWVKFSLEYCSFLKHSEDTMEATREHLKTIHS